MAIPTIYRTVSFKEDRARPKQPVETKHLTEIETTMQNFITHFKFQHL